MTISPAFRLCSLLLSLGGAGLTSCASMQQMQAKLQANMEQWQAKREEARIKKELAKLQEVPDLPEDGSLFPPLAPTEDSIFLDYDNPELAQSKPRRSSRREPQLTITGGLPMDDLPSSVSEFTNTVAIEGHASANEPSHQGTPIFREDLPSPTPAAALKTGVVSALAQALAPLVPGAPPPDTLVASEEPLSPAPAPERTAILTRLTAEHLNIAAAFAGRPAGNTPPPEAAKAPAPAPVAPPPAAPEAAATAESPGWEISVR